MTPSTSNRSGRPLGAAGPLASLVVGLMTVVGLGCAAVGVLPPALADAAGPAPSQTSESAGSRSTLDLRPVARTPAPAPSEKPAPPIPAPAPTSLPDIRVVDAAPRSQRSSKAAQPFRMRIAAVGLDVEVRPTGVAKDGSMELPDTVRRAGWYRFGSTPSEGSGTTVIAAHVDTRSEGLGPFARLTSARRGDRIIVTDRSGDEHAYRILSRRQIDRTRLPVDDLFDRDGPPRLVVLTCGGAYDARNGYRDNVVVIAESDR
ncbi:MAG TPA: class F sortase [Microlunatus sp.]